MSGDGFCIFGATGQGLAIGTRYQQLTRHRCGPFTAFIDDVRGGRDLELGGVPILAFDDWRARYRHLPCLVSLGLPAHRRTLAARLEGAGAILPRLYDDERAIPYVTVGPGSMVGIETYIGPLSTIGVNVMVLENVSIGHDVTIGDHSTICPQAAISGYVEIGDGVFIGAGAIVAPGRLGRRLRIGAGATIAAGTVITKDVPPGARMIGNPATTMREAVAARRGTVASATRGAAP